MFNQDTAIPSKMNGENCKDAKKAIFSFPENNLSLFVLFTQYSQREACSKSLDVLLTQVLLGAHLNLTFHDPLMGILYFHLALWQFDSFS